MSERESPPGRTRHLGRSRRYGAGDLPERLRHWHAPRANRWEFLRVVEGELDTQWLEAAGVATEHLATGDSCWIAPGSRWRIARMSDGAAFELEVHADDTVTPTAPQLRRAALLDAAATATIANPQQLAGQISRVSPGELLLLRSTIDLESPLREAISTSGGTLFWHPLEARADAHVALIGRTVEPAGLAEYLGRDHAVIEAALAGALRGDPERTRWLHNLLARHLMIEEDILFPAYLAAGGRTGWVQGLLNEHKQLRQHLPHLDNADSQRRFVLLLEGHDEKEEQIVYPAIIESIQKDGAAPAHAVVGLPLTDTVARLGVTP
jgi:tellurite resistance-related uncharacterized protein